MKKHVTFLTLALLLCCVVIVGCGRNVGLSGKVTFSDDGAPVPGGTICFLTPTFLARGTIKEDGTFIVGTLSESDGLPPGTYAVTISVPPLSTNGVPKLGPNNLPIAADPIIALKYGDRDKSGLSATVDATTKTLDFKVDRFKK